MLEDVQSGVAAPNTAVTASRKKSTELMGKLKVPGSGFLFKGITEIFNAFKPDPIAEINRKLDTANAMLSNTYNVVMATLEVWDLHKTIDASTATLGELMYEVEKDQRLANPGYPLRYVELRSMSRSLYDWAMGAVSEGGRLLSRYEVATVNDQGSFLSYLGKFEAIVGLPYQCVALAQRGFNTIVEHNDRLANGGKALEPDDRELEDDVNAAALTMGLKWQEFLEAVPSRYPKWCAPICRDEPFSLVTANPTGKGVRGLPATMGCSERGDRSLRSVRRRRMVKVQLPLAVSR